MRINRLVKTQTPHLNCSETGNWNSEEIKKCKKCFKESGYEKPFYCEEIGCTGEYEPKGTCSTISLVAQTIEQCEKPCYQKELTQHKSEGCNNDNECGEGNMCIKENTIVGGGQLHKNVGICKPKIKENYSNNNIGYKTLNTNPNLNLIDLLNLITTDNTWKIALHEVHNLTCQDIKDLVKLKVETSKKNGTYEIEKNKIIKSLNHINENPKIIDNTFNILETAVDNINCVIKEIHKEFDINNNDRVNVLTRSDNWSKQNKKEDKNKCNDLKNFKIWSIITIIILILIIVYLYMKQKQFNSM